MCNKLVLKLHLLFLHSDNALYVLILPQYSHCGEKLSCYPWKNLKQFISKAKYWGLERVFGGGPKLSCYGTAVEAPL